MMIENYGYMSNFEFSIRFKYIVYIEIDIIDNIICSQFNEMIFHVKYVSNIKININGEIFL